jgi:hypothetical protein
VTPGYESIYPNPGFDDVSINGVTAVSVGSQVTDSEDHPGWRKRLTNASLQDIGGNFYSQKQFAYGFPSVQRLSAVPRYVSNRTSYQTKYFGNVWSIDARTMPFPPGLNSSVEDLEKLGSTAIAQVKPTNSIANIAVTLAELRREGLPSVNINRWKDELRAHQNVGDTYLGYQFGLSPLGKEIGLFAAGVVQADRLLAQYERDAGRVVRRRYNFPPKSAIISTTEVGTSSFPFYDPYNTGFMNSSLTGVQTGLLIRQRTIEQRRWFSGAFTYYLPAGYDSRKRMHRMSLLAREILGVELTPEVLWNLAPWSWAVDWFSNFGDVISNVSSFATDGLLLRYGYMMEHTIVSDTYTRATPNLFREGGGRLDSAVTLVTETKMRRKANPYGFGLTWDGLSAFQLSILAALGISRAPRVGAND